MKIRPMTQKRKFFYFSFLKLSSQKNLGAFSLCVQFVSPFQRFLNSVPIVKVYFQPSTAFGLHLTWALQVAWKSLLVSLCSFGVFRLSFSLFQKKKQKNKNLSIFLRVPDPHPVPTSRLVQLASANDSAHTLARKYKQSEKDSLGFQSLHLHRLIICAPSPQNLYAETYSSM